MRAMPTSPLGHILNRAQEPVEINPEETYKQVTVRLFHKGVVLRGLQQGGAITSRQWRVRSGQVLLSRIDARNGAIGLIPQELDGAIVTNDFWAFDADRELAEPKYLDLYFGTRQFVEDCQRASEGTTNRVRVRPDRFLRIEVPLPPLAAQRRIVARIEELSAKIEEVKTQRSEVRKEADQLLLGLYHRIVANAKVLPLVKVAPLERRPVIIDPRKQYPQVAVRSFGNGIFRKRPLISSEVTWQKPYSVKSADILISNIKAWEGAIAVVAPEDNGAVVSHRYLTCVPIPKQSTAGFVCFHLLTAEGLRDVGAASPGSADRNRTLNIKSLLDIPVPVPPYEQQVWFDGLQTKIDSLKKNQEKSEAELDALIPSILSRAFSGEL